MIIDRFQNLQAQEVAELIKRNLLEVTSQYYAPEYVASLIEHHSPTQLLDQASKHHIFVAMLVTQHWDYFFANPNPDRVLITLKRMI